MAGQRFPVRDLPSAPVESVESETPAPDDPKVAAEAAAKREYDLEESQKDTSKYFAEASWAANARRGGAEAEMTAGVVNFLPVTLFVEQPHEESAEELTEKTK